MKIINSNIIIESFNKVEIVDISSKVEKIVSENKIEKGLVSIYSKHSTSAIVINENEDGLIEDFKNYLNKIVLEDNYKHNHIDNNAKSHIQSFLLGNSISIPIINSKIDLGTWQSIFFVELDGPRNRRTIKINIIGI